MAYSRTKVVEKIKSWLGRKESDGSHKMIVDIYNGHKPLARGYKLKYTDAWCAGTVSAVAINLGYTDIIPTEVSCPKMIELFKKLDAWVENDAYVPKPGDVIFYDWDDNGRGDNTGGSDHVGIVEKVVGSTITVIEGNYSNAVKRRNLSVNGRYIRGYGVPKYDEAETIAPKPVDKEDDKIEEDGVWGVATTTRAQQVFGTPVDGLVSNQYIGYANENPGLLNTTFEWKANPGFKGSSLIKAIQKKVGVTQDGYIGPTTIRAMQKWLGTPVDGRVNNPSTMVKAFQKWLNAQ